MSSSTPQNRLDEIGRTLRHAQATRSTQTDSWLNGYQDDVSWLLEQLEAQRVTLDFFVNQPDLVEPDDYIKARAEFFPASRQDG